MVEKKNLIKDIKAAATKLRNGKLKEHEAIKPALERIASKLDLKSTDEAMIFVAVFDRHCDERSSDISDLAGYFNCSTLAVMEYQSCLSGMAGRGILNHTNTDEFRMQKMEYNIGCPIC